MIDIEREDVFMLGQGPTKVGKSASGLRDMIIRGRRSIDGRLVKLEMCRLSGGTGTSVEALRRFRRALNEECEGAATNEKREHLPAVPVQATEKQTKVLFRSLRGRLA